MSEKKCPDQPPSIGWREDLKLPSADPKCDPTKKSSKKSKRRSRSTSSSSSSSSSSSTSSSSGSGSSDSDKRKKKKQKLEKIKAKKEAKKIHKERKREEHRKKKEQKKVRKEQKKLEKQQKKEERRAAKLKAKSVLAQPEDAVDCGPSIKLMNSKALAPQTREEWEARQKYIRHVKDEETGRTRLIKGDGEILEEIVTRDRHKTINKQATQGDGDFFQSRTVGWAMDRV